MLLFVVDLDRRSIGISLDDLNAYTINTLRVLISLIPGGHAHNAGQQNCLSEASRGQHLETRGYKKAAWSLLNGTYITNNVIYFLTSQSDFAFGCV